MLMNMMHDEVDEDGEAAEAYEIHENYGDGVGVGGGVESGSGIVYKLVRPKYVINRVCPLFFLAEISNELSATLKENKIDFIIGGSSALGIGLPVTSDYMRRRTSCDVDIFLQLKDYEKFDALMKKMDWKKYDVAECGLIQEYKISEGKRILLHAYPNIDNFSVYHKEIPEYKVDFLIYVSNIGGYVMRKTKHGRLIEQEGFNRSQAESFVHKIFRYTRRDKSDFLAFVETDGLQQLLEDEYAKETFLSYLSDERNVSKLKSYMTRMHDTRAKYWNNYRSGLGLKKISKRGKVKRPIEKMRVTLHYQTKDIEINSPYFEKLLLGMKERAYWLDESLKMLGGLVDTLPDKS